MSSSLHVSLPDEMRAYVDFRTSGETDFSTPSEYVRALIRMDMERESERAYVFKELMKSADDIKNNRVYAAGQIEERSKAFLDSANEEDR